MRIIVDEMPEDPCDCPYSSDELCEGDDGDEYVCKYKNKNSEQVCRCTSECPYFVCFKDMFDGEFDNRISDYDCQRYPDDYGW